MKIVLDANILIAALMGSRGTLNIITAQNHIFYAPSKIVDEIQKHKAVIFEKINISEKEFDENFKALLVFVKVIEYFNYYVHIDTAREALSQRDINDVDYLACALLVGADFIWTNDSDFSKQNLVPTRTTQEFIDIEKQHN